MEILRSSIEQHSESRLPWLPLILATLMALLAGSYITSILSNFRKKLPPGKLGFPLIGETISFVKAQKQDKIFEWVQSHERQYGPVFKTSLMGARTVIITGLAGNRFILGGNDNGLVAGLPAAARRIIGKYSIFEISGSTHKLFRGAITSFLTPESIQRYVSQMNSLVQRELLKELQDKDSVCVVPLMKKVTFKASCTLFFGLPEGKEIDELLENYTIALKGAWSLPFNIPGTSFAKGLKARARMWKYFSPLIEERKKELDAKKVGSQNDIISKFLILKNEMGQNISEEEILDNLISMMIASHDTTASLVTLLIRHLARDANAYLEILQEQNAVSKIVEENGGEIRWSEMQMMKHTWRVAQEVMRITPPVLGNFRRAKRDTSFSGYDIPEGWQVHWVAPGTHMDGSIFKDPEKFDPTRFENPSRFPPYTYIPFGAGPRSCPGAEFARVEVLLIIHYMVANFVWTEMEKNEIIAREGMPYPTMGLPIKLRRRNSS